MPVREKLRSTGRIVALCCFHQEKTPSLTIYPDGGYRCWGCKAMGYRYDDHPELIAVVRRVVPDLVPGTTHSVSPDQIWFRWENRCFPADPRRCCVEPCSIRYAVPPTS